jgi:hypothetical protein
MNLKSAIHGWLQRTEETDLATIHHDPFSSKSPFLGDLFSRFILLNLFFSVAGYDYS